MRGFERKDFLPALLVERDQPLGFRRKAAPRQRAVEGVRIVAYPTDVVHRYALRDVDARDEPGHDESITQTIRLVTPPAWPPQRRARSAATRFSTIRTDQIEPS